MVPAPLVGLPHLPIRSHRGGAGGAAEIHTYRDTYLALGGHTSHTPLGIIINHYITINEDSSGIQDAAASASGS